MKNFLVLIFLSGLFVFKASASEEDRSPAAVQANEKAHSKQYAGGKDEQEIKVQPSLPQPPKNVDGPSPGEPVDVDDHD